MARKIMDKQIFELEVQGTMHSSFELLQRTLVRWAKIILRQNIYIWGNLKANIGACPSVCVLYVMFLAALSSSIGYLVRWLVGCLLALSLDLLKL